MRYSSIAPLALVLLLAACGGNPFQTGEDDGGTPPDPTDPTVPAELAGSVESVTYTPGNGGTLDITLVPFDAPPITATYTREPLLDISGYEAFVPVTDPDINRNFVAYRAVVDGTVAIAVGDGGRGVDAFGGTAVQRTAAYAGPTTGLATYQGTYAGLRTQGDGSVTEQNPDRVTGDVVVFADFDQGAVEGSISNRVNIDEPDPTQQLLQDRFLKVTTIEADGTFQGEVMDASDSDVGGYAGAFSNDASGVVGVTAIDVGDSSGHQDSVREYGVFALPCVADTQSGSICP